MTPRSINRRQALTLLGAGVGAAALGACGAGGSSTDEAEEASTSSTASSTPAAAGGLDPAQFAAATTCKATVEQTEGPYYIDVDKIRSDIREDREGTMLRVGARVLDTDGCTPVANAVFEIWHCDAEGLYSGFESASTGGGGRGVSDAKRYLRGAQVTDANGIAVITTIWPGWYTGRTVHIHAKVALTNTELLTTQLYFDDALTDDVFKAEPYASNTGTRTRNSSDGIYRAGPTLTITPEAEGYLGLITIGVDA